MYDETFIFILIDITEEAVEVVVWKYSGSSDLGGTDSEALQGWLLKLGEEITRLRNSVESFVDWLANGNLTWAAYRSFMSGQLILLNKHPGLRPVGVGETWQRFFANILIKVTRVEAAMPCQDDQLCARLKVGINGMM